MAAPLSLVNWNNNTNTSRLFYIAGGTSSPITPVNQKKLHELYCELVRTGLITPTIATASNIVVTSTCNLYKAGFMNITGNTVIAKTIVQFYIAFKTLPDNSITQPLANYAYFMYNAGFVKWGGNATHAKSFYNIYKQSDGSITQQVADDAYKAFSIAMWQCKYINDNATLKITTTQNSREVKPNNDYKLLLGLSTTALVVSLITPIFYNWQMRRV
jgi:hypothetical protein